MSWLTVKISDITETVTKGTTPTTYGMPFTNEGVNFIKAEALNGDSALDYGGFTFISEETHAKLARSILKENDVLVTIAGANVGRCGYIKKQNLPANTNQAVGIVRIDPEKAEPRFVYYYFKHPSMCVQCLNIGGQAAQPNVNLGNLKSFDVLLPDRNVQKRIASILSAYDDLIENNRRRIVLLEEAARLLYREWFVHFRFPGHEHVKVIDGVPDGWNLVTFADLAEYLNGFAFKPYHLGETGLPIVKIPELRGGILPKTPRYEGLEVPDKYCIETGDLVFSWSGTLVVDFWTAGSAYLNQHLFKVTPISTASVAFLLIAIRDAMPRFLNQTVGATMKHIRRSALSDVRLLMPSKDILDDFQDVVDANYSQVRTLRQTNFTLTKARDLLLPRLMDGRLEV